jgi:hypothetical protein
VPPMEGYGDAVPGVHKRDGVGDVGNLLVVVVARQLLIRCVRSVRHRDMCQGLSPFKRSFLRLREVGALSPSGEAIEAFIGLTGLSQVTRVFAKVRESVFGPDERRTLADMRVGALLRYSAPIAVPAVGNVEEKLEDFG